MNTLGQFCSIGFLFICTLSMLSAVRDENLCHLVAAGVLTLVACMYSTFFMLREKLTNDERK